MGRVCHCIKPQARLACGFDNQKFSGRSWYHRENLRLAAGGTGALVGIREVSVNESFPVRNGYAANCTAGVVEETLPL